MRENKSILLFDLPFLQFYHLPLFSLHNVMDFVADNNFKISTRLHFMIMIDSDVGSWLQNHPLIYGLFVQCRGSGNPGFGFPLPQKHFPKGSARFTFLL